jgi:hypothetical protein
MTMEVLEAYKPFERVRIKQNGNNAVKNNFFEVVLIRMAKVFNLSTIISTATAKAVYFITFKMPLFYIDTPTNFVFFKVYRILF